jgi:hypothetical protein
MYMSSQCAAGNVTAIPTMIATIPMPVIAFAPLVAERLAYTPAARKGHLKLRQRPKLLRLRSVLLRRTELISPLSAPPLSCAGPFIVPTQIFLIRAASVHRGEMVYDTEVANW